MAPPKLVPSKFGGASRRAYQHGYSKSATNKVSDLLGKRKLSTPAFKQPRKPREVSYDPPKDTRAYGKSTRAADFGDTGFIDPDFEDPTDA